MLRTFVSAALVLGVLAFGSGSAAAHCEIPCGIYDDSTRFDLLAEHITTMEKSMAQIRELSADPGANANQLTRWVVNKEDHAGEFQHIVSQYFMTQRLKTLEPTAQGYAGYQKQLELTHRLLVGAMKCKQTTDQANIDSLRVTLDQFRTAYFGGQNHTH
ncbi:MAG TPA: superoxide dismutase [Ni] [candidate division Zixibacteria bacterium]|nr:superoxide dismutase [candidate division Zixibacteria bacterium]MDD4916740.1 superoxide dismutase [Ni] [candidate division Zixibacteria bacterium]MDM7973819.1 superoxide dismutase [Ni] [candidate division Zixibacteria bacterium]HOD65364.1 superoxide dismutase [Ni] [candidate division Zixibacteria bacterium]HOZ07760.1 superoxide dismutase [Ni] [candidate division Zixibacteria bacterium]